MATGSGGTAVGSEKKCLLDLAEALGIDTRHRRPSRAALHGAAVRAGTRDTAPRYPAAGVGQLRPRAAGRAAGGDPVLHSRVSPPTPFRRRADEQSRYDEITAVLEDSVAKHMRADVTVGAFLSGGIDSTAIAALAMRHNPRLITFTTGFEREGFSEVDVAVASAEAIGARHVTKVVSQAEFVAALPEIVWYLDEPVADPALVPLFFIAREARKHVKVVLSGEGADELFGGYTIYREPLSLKPFDYLPRPLRRSLGKASQTAARGYARQEPASPRIADPRRALLRQRAQLLRRAAAGGAAGLPAGVDAHRRHRAGVRHVRRLGSGGADAAHRPVHLAARRHPGQGRQDDDGQLARIAGAVPGSRGVRGGVAAAAGPEDHQGHHQVRAAQGAGADRSRACAATGRSSASPCRSGTGCAPANCWTGRTPWSTRHRPANWSTSPRCGPCSTNTAAAQAITAAGCGRC